MNTYIKATGVELIPWVRPNDWLPMPTVNITDDTFVGLHAIFPEGNNFVAMNFSTSSGQYQVDWGDGNITLHNSAVTAQYEYNYNTYDVGNTTLTSRGYKQAIIKVTAVSGLLTVANLNVKYSGQGTQYSTGYLDCILSMPNAAVGLTITVGGIDVRNSYCERFDVKTIGNCSGLSNFFLDFFELEVVSLFDTSNVAGMANMFQNCYTIQTIPLYDTSAVTDMQYMFASCFSLPYVPLFDTSSVINMRNMFAGCRSLKYVPRFDTSVVTDMQYMFQNCHSLQSVPHFDTSLVTNMRNMFQLCVSLKVIPLFDTSLVTTMESMFTDCLMLKEVPQFNTSSVTNMFATFAGCIGLESIALLDTSLAINLGYFVAACHSLKSVPLFNTAAATNMQFTFFNCHSLQKLPALSTASITALVGVNFDSFALGANSLDRCEMAFSRSVTFANAQLSKTALEEIFGNLVSRVSSSATITISGNFGVGTIVSRSFTITSGSKTITTADTSNLVAGMQVTGTGSPLTTAVSVTFQDAGDTVTLVNHQLENGDEVSFPTITTTTGLTANTIYYIVNKAADTFQLATSIGGSPLPLTNNGTGTMRHRTEIVSIVPNTSITMSRPMRGSGAQTLAFRLLKTGTALLKNWAVTG
jgi:surface protein